MAACPDAHMVRIHGLLGGSSTRQTATIPSAFGFEGVARPDRLHGVQRCHLEPDHVQRREARSWYAPRRLLPVLPEVQRRELLGPIGAGQRRLVHRGDRDAKENIDRVDAVAVLDKLAAIPLSTWNWKSQDPGIHHVGPMAQDFDAAFGLGETRERIDTVDADGRVRRDTGIGRSSKRSLQSRRVQ